MSRVSPRATLAYTDNGNGTITDLNTGLTWEKLKSDDGGLHDRDNSYRWSGDGTQETIWDWIEDVNAEGGTGFAGYPDWRIPNVKELQSIIDYGRSGPAIDPVFNSACAAACTVLTCSCTASALHWPSSAYAPNTSNAWFVDFVDGGVLGFGDFRHEARALSQGLVVATVRELGARGGCCGGRVVEVQEGGALTPGQRGVARGYAQARS